MALVAERDQVLDPVIGLAGGIAIPITVMDQEFAGRSAELTAETISLHGGISWTLDMAGKGKTASMFSARRTSPVWLPLVCARRNRTTTALAQTCRLTRKDQMASLGLQFEVCLMPLGETFQASRTIRSGRSVTTLVAKSGLGPPVPECRDAVKAGTAVDQTRFRRDTATSDTKAGLATSLSDHAGLFLRHAHGIPPSPSIHQKAGMSK